VLPLMLPERLRNHCLAGNGIAGPVDVVRWHGAVQAQDFPGALWAVGQRLTPGLAEADVLAAFDAGGVIRTHVLRPTWHFVAHEDLRWMLALTAPRLQSGSAARYAAVGLDAPTRAKADRAMARALEGGRHLTRHQLAEALRRVRVDPGGQRLMHLLFHAELEGLICSGPRVGKDLTYALLDERVAPARPRDREDALAALMTRYFASHGPATVRDAAWWSGLSMGAVREGIALAGEAVERRVVGETEYWVGADVQVPPPAPRHAGARSPRGAPTVLLLPSYDEYTVAYRDRTALLHASTPSSTAAQSALLQQPVMLDGRHVGSWRRTMPTRPGAPVVVEVRLLQPLTAVQRTALANAAERYGAFLGRAVTLRVDDSDSDAVPL
jgi:hypothetical protein